jgi:hypothetical protein
MRAGERVFSIAVWLTALAGSFALHACSDVGDSSAIPNGEVAEDAGSPTAEDASGSENEEAEAPDGPVSGGSEASAGDANVPVSTDSGTPEDAGSADAFVGSEDAGGSDATVIDSGAHDAGGIVAVDAAVDAGVDSSVPVDAGKTLDAGADAGHGPSALAPCTAVGQTNCVQCQYNNGASGKLPNATELCTPTEVTIVERDIATGQATSAGPAPDSSCYACAALSGCLDDSEFDDQGHECEDLSGASSASECEATLACVLSTSCGSDVISTCYCGTAPVSGACAAAGASNAANGACKAAEATGLGFAATDGLDILKNFTSTTLPSGVANNILQCAASNNCTSCLH